MTWPSDTALWWCALALAVAVGLWPAPRWLTLTRTPRTGSRFGLLARSDPQAECLAVLDALGAVLRAGAPTSNAVELVVAPYADGGTHSSQGWQRLRHAVRSGGDLADTWRGLGVMWRLPACADIAAAWEMSDRHGCPLADAVTSAAADLRARRRHDRALEAATAGAKATMGVLVLLPVLGMALAWMLGVDVFEIYSGTSGLLTLWPGLALLWAGATWSQRMVASALKPPAVTP